MINDVYPYRGMFYDTRTSSLHRYFSTNTKNTKGALSAFAQAIIHLTNRWRNTVIGNNQKNTENAHSATH